MKQWVEIENFYGLVNKKQVHRLQILFDEEAWVALFNSL
jgi:hypothetical protein